MPISKQLESSQQAVECDFCAENELTVTYSSDNVVCVANLPLQRPAVIYEGGRPPGSVTITT